MLGFLGIWERNVLRTIYGSGPVCIGGGVEEAIWASPDIVAMAKMNRIRWTGHVERMDENRHPKRI